MGTTLAVVKDYRRWRYHAIHLVPAFLYRRCLHYDLYATTLPTPHRATCLLIVYRSYFFFACLSSRMVFFAMPASDLPTLPAFPHRTCLPWTLRLLPLCADLAITGLNISRWLLYMNAFSFRGLMIAFVQGGVRCDRRAGGNRFHAIRLWRAVCGDWTFAADSGTVAPPVLAGSASGMIIAVWRGQRSRMLGLRRDAFKYNLYLCWYSRPSCRLISTKRLAVLCRTCRLQHRQSHHACRRATTLDAFSTRMVLCCGWKDFIAVCCRCWCLPLPSGRARSGAITPGVLPFYQATSSRQLFMGYTLKNVVCAGILVAAAKEAVAASYGWDADSLKLAAATCLITADIILYLLYSSLLLHPHTCLHGILLNHSVSLFWTAGSVTGWASFGWCSRSTVAARRVG